MPPPVAEPVQQPEEDQSKKGGGDQEWTEEQHKTWEDKWNNKVKNASVVYYGRRLDAHFPTGNKSIQTANNFSIEEIAAYAEQQQA